jgi:HSP20 family protein
MENPSRTPTGAPRHPSLPQSRAEQDFMRGDAWFEPDLPTRIGPVFSPSFDLIETREKFTLLGDLPGLGLGDLDIELTAHSLTIAGERDGENLLALDSCHAMERTFGSFLRTFHFPEGIEEEKGAADMKNGVLTVVVPKRVVDPLPPNLLGRGFQPISRRTGQS